jgi:DNA ligase-associated metallophosphoesterase
MKGVVELKVHGETLWLHPQRAVVWERGRALIVADTHFAKSSALARHGMAIPAGTDEGDRARLTQLLSEVSAKRLIILGDFLHEPIAPDSPEAVHMQRWCDSLRDTHIQVIAGNHDRGVSMGWRGSIEWIDGEHEESPFRFIHDDSRTSPGKSAFSLSGHVHPVVALRGLRKRSSRVPAFWLRKQGLILPSFGSFTGGHLIEPANGEQLFAVSPEQVVAFPARSSDR